MNEYILVAALPGRHGSMAVSLAPEQDRADGPPARLASIEAAAGSGHESLEDGILALLPVLHRTAFRMTAGQDAEDLVQDTVIRALTFSHQFRSGSNLRAWLITIMRSLATSAYRRTRRAPQVQSLDGGEMEEALYGPDGLHGSPSAEHVMFRTWLDRDLQAALAALPEHFRRAVELCDVEGLSYQEAAHALGCPLGTVMSRLHRGRSLLREALAGSGRGQRNGMPARARTRRTLGVAAEAATLPEAQAA